MLNISPLELAVLLFLLVLFALFVVGIAGVAVLLTRKGRKRDRPVRGTDPPPER